MLISSTQCVNCHHRNASTVLNLCVPCDKILFSHSSKATTLGISKLLNIKGETLKRLEATGEIIPTRNDYGSRLYTRESIEQYVRTKGWLKESSPATRRTSIKPSNYFDVNESELDAINNDDMHEGLCIICYENNAEKLEYCQSCFEDLTSIGIAAQIYGIKPHQLKTLITNPSNNISTYKYGSQIRIRHSEIERFFAVHGNVKGALGAKWSNHYKVCVSCKQNTNPYWGSGYCSECYPKSKQAIVYARYKNGETLQEVGDHLGLTRERVRQLIAKATRDRFEHQNQEDGYKNIMRRRGRGRSTSDASEEIQPKVDVDEDALATALSIHGKKCYVCQKAYNSVHGNMAVYYADNDSQNLSEDNVYPICTSCLANM